MDYFNTKDYLNYLLKNFNVISKGEETDTTRPDISVIDSYIEKLNPKKEDRILEIGCGLGRLLDRINSRYGSNIFGIDVCDEAIKVAKDNLPFFSNNLTCSAAESLPYEDSFFDIIIVWGVFDLTLQDQALNEMSRVLKRGGKILLTGRNNNYHQDDEEAKIAEVNIIKKNMPIHYTDLSQMKKFCHLIGLKINHQDIFERRGDFAQLKIASDPIYFYEFLLILTKTRDTKPQRSIFYSRFSKTLGYQT